MTQQKANRLAAQRQRESRASLFAMDPREIEDLIRKAQGIVANGFRKKAGVLGIRGHQFTEWVEDMVTEGFCLAEETIDKWDPERGPAWHWISMKAQNFASRWLKRFEDERETFQQFAERMFPRLESLAREAAGHGRIESFEFEICLEQLLSAELSLAQQRMLKLSHEGFSLREIAEREMRSEDTTRRFIHRAQEKARRVRPLYGLDWNSRDGPSLQNLSNHVLPMRTQHTTSRQETDQDDR